MNRGGANSGAPRISLCMIVRDEARFLPGCLEAARAAVDEIVVIDTGSRDGTPEIAARHGARVFSHAWNDDFSEARNASLERATGEWILWLDADEILQPGAVAEIRKAVCDSNAAGYYLAFTNLLDEGRESHFLVPRLFLNRPEIRFVNAIHEQILESLEVYAGERGLRIPICPARVLHYGYLQAEIDQKGKRERTTRISHKQLAKRPDDPYSWYKFGDFVRKDDRAEGILALQRSLELLRGAKPELRNRALYGADAAAILATELQADGREEEARRALAVVDEIGLSKTPSFLFGSACVARLQGKHASALRGFEACLEFADRTLTLPIPWGICGPLAQYGIAECKAALGDLPGAEAAYRKALELAPQHLEIVLACASFLLKRQRPIDALETLTAYLEATPERNDLWKKTGQRLLDLALREVEALILPAKNEYPR